MDNRSEVREFLVSRRAKITPERADLPAGTNRRVPGLRRTEVTALAGVSIEYYSKLERGALAGVSAGVLNAIARALQLDDAQRAHLFDLAQAADGSNTLMRPRRRRSKQWTPHRSLQWTLDAVTEGPAFVRNGRMDLLATNRLAPAFYAQVYADPQRPANLAWFTFLDDNAHRFYPDWDSAADICLAILRTEAGRDPRDKDLHDLVGELSTRSAEFRSPLGSPQSATTAPARRPPPPHRRRLHPRLRRPGDGRRTRLPVRRRTSPARLLGRLTRNRHENTNACCRVTSPPKGRTVSRHLMGQRMGE